MKYYQGSACVPKNSRRTELEVCTHSACRKESSIGVWDSSSTDAHSGDVTPRDRT
ncbi:hypothetical protein J6590_042649 [Homalodisca vitripennis]|nr:hypothetical protein J6590_042649 [Homalodisca vitripennis]